MGHKTLKKRNKTSAFAKWPDRGSLLYYFFLYRQGRGDSFFFVFVWCLLAQYLYFLYLVFLPLLLFS